MAMAQNLTDFGKRSAMVQHLGGQAVSELMGTISRSFHTGTLDRMPND